MNKYTGKQTHTHTRKYRKRCGLYLIMSKYFLEIDIFCHQNARKQMKPYKFGISLDKRKMYEENL